MGRKKSQVLRAEKKKKEFPEFPDVIQSGNGGREIVLIEDSQEVLASGLKGLADKDELTGIYSPVRYSLYDFFAGQILDLIPGQLGIKCDYYKQNSITLSSMYWDISNRHRTVEKNPPPHCVPEIKYHYPAEWRRIVPFTHKENTMQAKPTPSERLDSRWRRKANSVYNCSNLIITETDQESLLEKIVYISSCKSRLCPVCAWRRSLKIAVQMRMITEAIEKDFPGEYRYIFLTLTVPNVFGAEALRGKLTEMLEGWRRMTNFRVRSSPVTRRFHDSTAGFYRGLEVSCNTDYYKMRYRDMPDGTRRKVLDLHYDSVTGEWQKQPNPLYGSYHPHFHVVLCVPKAYFEHQGLYISRDEFTDMWRWAMKDPTISQVDVRIVRPKSDILLSDTSDMSVATARAHAINAAIAEVTKYTVKPGDYVRAPGDVDYNRALRAVGDLDLALERKQLVGHGGIFLEYFNKLKLSDPVDGDLSDIADIAPDDLDHIYRCYGFSTGLGHYIRTDVFHGRN